MILIGAGIAWAGSQGGSSVLGVPVFALAVGLAFAIQWLAFIPAYVFQTERFFDIVGSLTYVSLTLMALILTAAPDPRSIVLTTLVLIWAVRLGAFLSTRIHKVGKDERFDEIKPSPLRFFTAWTLQGLWVSVTLGAALAAITSTGPAGFGVPGVVGLAAWVLGFGVEVAADAQKARFRENPENEGRFIRSGLWAWSRHPNYFGEIVLWIGIALIALPALQGWQMATLVSPVFVALLLTRVSGVPKLEKKADEKWGGLTDYEDYKEQTPLLIPLPPPNASG